MRMVVSASLTKFLVEEPLLPPFSALPRLVGGPPVTDCFILAFRDTSFRFSPTPCSYSDSMRAYFKLRADFVSIDLR